MRRPTLCTITLAALLLNTLLFVSDVFSSGPNGLNLGHIIPSLVGAAPWFVNVGLLGSLGWVFL